MTAMPPDPRRSILFVCLGNICRSPLAEGVFRHRVAEAGLQDRFRIASAGTGGWHVGDPPDPRSRAVAEARGVSLEGQTAQRVSPSDFDDFDLIVAMDRSNLSDLQRSAGGDRRASLVLLRDYDPEPGDGEVPDPYYGGPGGFDRVFDMVDRCCARLLDTLRDDV